CRALRLGLDADVEIDRAVERGLLVEEQVLELGVESFARVGACEVGLLLAPSGDGIDDAGDELADAGLAPGRSERPRKYFETTTLVAVCDHARGTSTSFCSKTTRPSSPVITAVRRSHSSSDIGST